MDSSKKYNNPSPESTTNILSRTFFCWIIPFVRYAYKNDLQTKDIYSAHNDDLCGPLADKLQKNWDKELKIANEKKRGPSLRKALFKTFFKSFMFYGIFSFIEVIVLKSLMPLVLAEYIRYFANSDSKQDESKYLQLGWLLGAAIVLLSFLLMLVYHHAQLGCQRVGMRARVACCSLIYRKILKLSQASLEQTAAGQVVNLLSNDLQRFDNVSMFLHYLWIMPLQAAISFYIMYRSVGIAALAAFAGMLLEALPLQGYLSKAQGTLRLKIAHRTDHRVKLMNEIVNGIKVIKMYAWEKSFNKLVEITRKLEIDVITKTSYIRGFSLALMVFTERVALYLALLAYILLGNRLTSDVVFSMAQLINSIQLYMCIFYPHALANFAETKVSIKRLEKFLLMEENNTKFISDVTAKIGKPHGTILTEKATASWSSTPSVDTLTDINLDIDPGKLCCVVGSVGSGKSSLLHMLLKELPLTCGNIDISGVISYASQEPWLFVSSVRNNILFGREYVRKRYDEVVKVCALERDLELFPHGDKTLVEERGVSLSGGQRARINLARTVYAEADIYLLDDPLSAVDTHVGKHLFEQCIQKFLHGKTRIVVTHQIQFLKQADLIIIMKNGKISTMGTYDELSNNELASMFPDTTEEEKDKPQEGDPKKLLETLSEINLMSEEKGPEKSEEEVETGAISFSIYRKYYRYGASVFALVFLVFLLIFAQLFSNGADLFITYWTNKLEAHHNATQSNNKSALNKTLSGIKPNETVFISLPSNTSTGLLHFENSTLFNNTFEQYFNYTILKDTSFPSTQEDYIIIYSLFIIASMILTPLRSLLFFKIMMNASKGLHNNMFINILKAPIKFFDTNPSGRILNRFSYDMGVVDELLPKVTLEAIQVFLVMSGILMMVFIVSPMMILPAVFLAMLFFYLRHVYVKSAQDIKRLEGVNKAPVFSHITASLYGLPTIRASNAESMIIKEFDCLQDQHTGTWYMYIASSEVFGFYLDVICTVFLALVTFQFLIFREGNILSGNVGLVISQSLILTGMLQLGVRRSAEVASYMISVERVLQYTKLESEGDDDLSIKSISQEMAFKGKLRFINPEKNWPQVGRIEFRNTFLRYDPNSPAVLKNLNIEIAGGEKVGVVGRTGAGKSSLISSLFRLTPIEGTILIDDVDTSKIPLEELRSHISIIPQEPVLFSSSVRYNLDPFNKVDDDVLWRALENVELKSAIESLDQQVSEGGSNFSAGQRQLMCLARAIVRNNKILVMDEATANVDHHTDSLIQKTIRENFKDCTVLTIAHRLNTIMDSDKVLVMDAGEAVEFAHPHKLLQDPNGYFTKMVKQTGSTMEVVLRKVAKEDYEKKFCEKTS